MSPRDHLLVLLCGSVILGATGCQREQPWSISAADSATKRTTVSGEVVGGLGRSGSHAWLGIPFAAPPVGDLRWRVPVPPATWTGTREALHFAAGCPQFATPIGGDVSAKPGEPSGSEDCLYLNIWAPPLAPNHVPDGADRLPVMFWIHGGGNSVGTASFYDPSALAVSQHVIVVTTQYRLGPFGWFRHKSLRADDPDPAGQSGNFGTLDLIRSLQWVRDNIGAFGGDPGNVTLFGESAGGLDVYSLLLSPPASGLFHRAIVESGGLSETTTEEAEHFIDDPAPGQKQSSNEILLKLLQRDGLAMDRATAKTHLAAMSDAEVAAYLKAKPALQILTAYDFHKGSGLINMPLAIRDGTVLPGGDWAGRFAQPGWNRVPVILGTNRDEATLMMAFDPRHVWREFGAIPRYVDEPNYHATAEYLSRARKAGAVDRPAAAMRKSGQKEVYAYRFDWHGEPTVGGTDLGQLLGAAHSFEIPFVFDRFYLGKAGEILFDKKDLDEREQLSSAMMSYWAQFARTGSPGRGAKGDLVDWQAWVEGRERPKFLILDTASEGGIRPAMEVETRERIIADIDSDARLVSQVSKCRVFHELAGGSHAISKDQYAHIGQRGCAAFPFDAFPWDSAGK